MFFADSFIDRQPTFSKLCWCYWFTCGNLTWLTVVQSCDQVQPQRSSGPRFKVGRVLLLHQLLSLHVVRSFLTTLLHLVLSLPLGREPGIGQKKAFLGVLESSIHLTCPSHLSLCLRRLSQTVGWLHLSRIWTWSRMETWSPDYDVVLPGNFTFFPEVLSVTDQRDSSTSCPCLIVLFNSMMVLIDRF